MGIKNNNIIVISGPTASGKSYLALELAKKINGTVINADAMQIYKGLPILSAQPSVEEKSMVEHKLYGVFDPIESNSVFKWLKLVKNIIDKTVKNNKIPIVVGGSGMYISRLINGIRELPDTDENLRIKLNELYNDIGWDEFYKIVENIDKESLINLKKNDKHRLIKIYEIYKTSGKKLSEWEKLPNSNIFDINDFIHINLFPDRDILYDRCEKRFNIMMKSAVDEVEVFISKYDIFNGKKYPILNTIGLLEIKDYIDNKISFDEVVNRAVKKTRNYAKRQYTWFKNQFKFLDFLINEIPNCDNINYIIGGILK